MRQTMTGKKRPLFIISGLAIVGFGVARFFYEEPEVILGIMWVSLGILNLLQSGYLYSYRKLIIENDGITLININKTRKRKIDKEAILRIWENKTHIIVDLLDEAIEIEKDIFNKPETVALALTKIK